MALRTMKNMREREIKLLPQTRSPEVDYSPLIMVMMRKTLEKVEIPPTAAPAEFPPPIFAAAASVFVFRCFCGAPLQRTLRGHIDSGFLGQNTSVRERIK